MRQASSWPTILAGVLLAFHAGLLAWCDYRNSPALDEVGHLPGGLAIWKYGRFDLYRVNPPLVRAVAALPVLFSLPAYDWSHYSDAPGVRPEWGIGSDFINANGERAFWMFTLARWACIPFSLLGGIVCWRWARALYGSRAGLLALALWCLSPNILGNACMITPDVAAAACGLLAAFTCWRWLEQGTWSSALQAGFALGLAELAKMSWIILFGLWPVLWAAHRLTMARREDPSSGTGSVQVHFAPFRQLMLVLLLGLYVLNLGYAFDGTGQRLGRFDFVSATLAGGPIPNEGILRTGNRFRGTLLGDIPVPLPRDYLTGLDLQKHDFEAGKPSYLRGEFQPRGWWYYYAYAALVKLTPGILVLSAIAAVITCGRFGSRPRIATLVLTVPGMAVFVLVSSQTGFNRYFRYVLPALPFLFVWVSQAAELWTDRHRSMPRSGNPCGAPSRTWSRARGCGGLLAATALIWSVCSSLACFPHSMSYFSDIVGGPRRGHEHLIDANLDWGQDLFYLKAWIERHPAARPLTVNYWGFFDPRAAGVDFPKLSPKSFSRSTTTGGIGVTAQLPAGWHALSMYYLVDESHEYDGLMQQNPAGFAGYSIRIYYIAADNGAGQSSGARPGPGGAASP